MFVQASIDDRCRLALPVFHRTRLSNNYSLDLAAAHVLPW